MSDCCFSNFICSCLPAASAVALSNGAFSIGAYAVVAWLLSLLSFSFVAGNTTQ